MSGRLVGVQKILARLGSYTEIEMCYVGTIKSIRGVNTFIWLIGSLKHVMQIKRIFDIILFNIL